MDGVVFDKDGTLLDFQKTWEPVMRASADLASGGDPRLADLMLRHCGMDPATGITAADSIFAAGNTAEIAQGMIACGSMMKRAELTTALDALSLQSAMHSVPLFDIGALFSELQTYGIRIGVASSDNEASIRRMLEAFGVASLVDFVAGYDSGHGVKPGGGMVSAFCSACQLEPGRVAVVGDNTHDMAMGRAAGAGMLVGVLTGTGTRETLTPVADHILDDLRDLANLFRNS